MSGWPRRSMNASRSGKSFPRDAGSAIWLCTVLTFSREKPFFVISSVIDPFYQKKIPKNDPHLEGRHRGARLLSGGLLFSARCLPVRASSRRPRGKHPVCPGGGAQANPGGPLPAATAPVAAGSMRGRPAGAQSRICSRWSGFPTISLHKFTDRVSSLGVTLWLKKTLTVFFAGEIVSITAPGASGFTSTHASFWRV